VLQPQVEPNSFTSIDVKLWQKMGDRAASVDINVGNYSVGEVPVNKEA
jgi:hypothetical protein